MGKYETFVCTKNEIDKWMGFVKSNWDNTHVLATDRTFVDYAFFDARKDCYNILYALDADTSAIVGFIAYIPTSFFDGEISPADDFCWITNWLVTDEAKGTVGISLYMKLCAVSGCKNMGTVGQNEMAEMIYKSLKYDIGRLTHYFMVRDGQKKFVILSNYLSGYFCDKPACHRSLEAKPFPRLQEIQLKQIENCNISHPKKTADYIISKYLKSPYYDYFAYGVSNEEYLCGAIIFKVVSYNGSKCIRIVEYFGDSTALSDKREQFQMLLAQFDAEYLDFYCYGIAKSLMNSSGFEVNTGQNRLIVPNYFEPFLNKNVEIRCVHKFTQKPDYVTIFKGDCDREHPRIIKH